MALNFLNDGYFAGKVGIGTASPGAKLSIAAGASDANTEQIRFNRTNDEFRYNSIFSTISSSSSTAKISFGVHDSVTSTSQATVMSLLGNGNVGIGTTSPRSIIEAKGNISIFDPSNTLSNGDTLNGLHFYTDEYSYNPPGGRVNTPISKILPVVDSSGTDSFGLSFYTAASDVESSEKLRISSSGNVGIGTTSPTAKLHVVGTGLFTGLVSGITPVAAANFVTKAYVDGSGGGTGPFLPLAGGTMTGSIDFVNSKDISMTDSAGAITRVMVLNTSNTMYIGPVDTYAGGSILYGTAAGVSFQRFFTGASERLRIGSNGNIAIGTTATTYRLQVEQDNDGNLLSRFHNTAANGQGLLIRAGGVSSANRILQLSSENDTKVMTVNSNGRVGIGIANPTEKLEVVGNVLITAALLSNQENTDVDTGTETVANVAIATYTAAFFDFVIKKTTNVRSGTVYACHDGTNVVYTETSTNDLGDTSDVTLSVDISGGNMRLLATVTSDDWSVKSLIRAI